MIRKLILLAGMSLLPAAVLAQQPKHPADNTAKVGTQTKPHTAEMKQHEMFVQTLIDKRAELKLTDEQVTKLKAFKTKMLAHHDAMMKGDMKDMKDMKEMKEAKEVKEAKEAKEAKEMKEMKEMKESPKMADAMHNEMMAIFTPEQRKQVDALMKEHMAQCAKDGKTQCPMMHSGMDDMKNMPGMKKEAPKKVAPKK